MGTGKTVNMIETLPQKRQREFQLRAFLKIKWHVMWHPVINKHLI